MLGVAPAPAAGPPPRAPAPANLKGTMLGVAPAAAGPGAAPVAPGWPPAVPPPAVGAAPAAPIAAPPTLGKPPPMPPRRGADAKPAPPISEVDSFFDDVDLPVPVQPLAARPAAPATPEPVPLPRRAPSEPDLPVARAPQGFEDLPMPAAPEPFEDLPVAASPKGIPAAPFSLDLDFDLPSARATPASGAASRSSSSEIDLHLRSLGSRAKPEVGLPSLSQRPPSADSAGLPAPARSPAAVTTARQGSFGDVNLPSLAGSGLPEPRRSASPPRANIDLPSLGGGRKSSPDLDFDDGLPLVGPDLPALSGAGLPERSAGLPALGGNCPSYSPSGFSSVQPPASASGLELPSPRPPAPSTPASFAAIELQRAPSLPPDFGMDPVSPSARSSRPDFGELELPIGGRGYSQRGVPVAPPLDAQEADLFGESPRPAFGRGTSERAPEAVVRQSGGGTAYGEVNLGDEGGEADVPIDGSPATRHDEDMEFGAIPQEAPSRSSARAGADEAASALGKSAAPRRPRGGVTGATPTSKRKLPVRLLAGGLVLFLGGASLALVPSIGPFGAYVIVDHLKAGENQQLVERTVESARAQLGSDTYPAAKQALGSLENARLNNKRVRALPAYAAFTAYADELRFGADPAVHARASVLLDELAEYPETPFVALARCARAAAEGQIARAKQLFDGLPAVAADEPDRALLQGEIALRTGDRKAAPAIWRQALLKQHSPRASFGLARASYAAADFAAAASAARDTLAQNPNHVGARILLARINGAERRGEVEALALLGAVAKNPANASPDEVVSAQTLLGDIHLARSRMSQAEAAYSEALKINPKAARALSGLGDALYRAGRFSEAEARYEASTQADPDDLSAKIGVAKSKLALERVEEASGTLKKLHDTHPDSVPVAYWYGKTLEAAGGRAAAETVYRSALKTAKSDDPQTVDVFIALALLQSQLGRNDEAQKTLGEARAKSPDLPAIHKALGDVALSQGRYAQALTEFKQAVALDGEDLGSKFRLGVALRRDGKFDDALAAFEQVAAVDADYPGLSLERGLLFEASGRAKEALDQYEISLLKAPRDPDLMLRVGCAKVAAGRAKQAEELLRKVLIDRPNSAETNHCLGRALLLEGTRLAEALRLLERAVELDPNRAEYHLYAGWAANEAGNIPKAEHSLGEALRLDQGLADAYWQRGVLRQRQGAARDAIADLTRALELRPSRYEAHAALADAYYDLGKEPQALSQWQLAIQAQSDNATWRFRYGKLLSANHQTDLAREQLGKALELSASDDPAPRWAWEAHHLLARAIGLKPDAIKHWQEFLRLGPRDSPYRAEAKASLDKLGHPWTED